VGYFEMTKGNKRPKLVFSIETIPTPDVQLELFAQFDSAIFLNNNQLQPL